jgi:serine/threonine protein kinase
MSAAPDVHDDELPRPFASYLLLQNFARGGMGDVYLAKSGGLAGLERVCVLKKLRSDLTRDREYVTRFIDEARVVVTLNHRNICNVFDVGRVDNEYYLAMEYVSGRDVRALQERCRKREVLPPPAAALTITCEVLEALDYAHRRHHPVTQEPLNLVHRDISPQNVLVSYEGEVKLIDFGLAASRLKVERTQPNVVMGKMAYMAPEQARGDPIDARADLFACGVLAYELLTNERFYEGMSATDIWQVAGRGGFMPRAWGSIDPPLSSILARALHPDPRRRFPSCGEFREALLGYLHERFPGTGGRMLRNLMEQLFDEELAHERAQLARFSAITVGSTTTPVESTRSHSVSLAGRDRQTDENSGSYAGHMPPPVARPDSTTDEGSPLGTAQRGALDDPTRLDGDPRRSSADGGGDEPNLAVRPQALGAVDATLRAPAFEGTARIARPRRGAAARRADEVDDDDATRPMREEDVTALDAVGSRRRWWLAAALAGVAAVALAVALTRGTDAPTDTPAGGPPSAPQAMTTPTGATTGATTTAPPTSGTTTPAAPTNQAAATSPSPAPTTTDPSASVAEAGRPRGRTRTKTTAPTATAPTATAPTAPTAPISTAPISTAPISTAPTATGRPPGPARSTATVWKRLRRDHPKLACVSALIWKEQSEADFLTRYDDDIRNCAASAGARP